MEPLSFLHGCDISEHIPELHLWELLAPLIPSTGQQQPDIQVAFIMACFGSQMHVFDGQGTSGLIWSPERSTIKGDKGHIDLGFGSGENCLNSSVRPFFLNH